MSNTSVRRPTLKDRIRYKKHDYEREFFDEPLPAQDERTEFERDRSRIIHSAAFRRLQGKTQVYMIGEGDFLRTRLTHSLEVAQIGKGVALRLRADPDLVEAVSLLHDIGHPPFGHAGETELKALMKPFGGFEANAQNIRIIRQLETKREDYPGLNLSRAVIDGQLKYKVTPDEDENKFVYADDMDLVDWASEEAISTAQFKGPKPQSFECQIMDWADDVAYAVHDLEDSIHTGYIDSYILSQSDVLDKNALNKLKSDFKDQEVDVEAVYRDFIAEIAQHLFGSVPSRHARELRSQKANRKRLTSFLIKRYIKGTGRIDCIEGVVSPVSYRYCFRLSVPIVHQVEVAIINMIIWDYVIKSPQIRTLEEKGKHMIKCLFVKFMQKDNAFTLLPSDWQEYLFEGGERVNRRKKARVVCDYISGMTDDYAQKVFAKLFLPNYGSIYERL